jgi:hypothetical protein
VVFWAKGDESVGAALDPPLWIVPDTNAFSRSLFLSLPNEALSLLLLSDAPWLNSRRPGSLYSIVEYEQILLCKNFS